ncbi:uncharacterized protein METZ01_LOCUS256590, partial [marine metagenome]
MGIIYGAFPSFYGVHRRPVPMNGCPS